MARIDLLSEVYAKKQLIKNFDFDKLLHLPISYYLNQSDIDRIKYIASSAKWGAKLKKEKMAEFDRVLVPRGFKWFHSGTNRAIYENIYDHTFLIKLPFDDIGFEDNKDEMINQRILKPFVSKTFDVTSCGTVALVERVQPISNRYQFEDVAEEIFDILYNFFIGKYVLEDIGTDFFQNWGIREGFGPVLLDYPYIFELDGNKLYCKGRDSLGHICNGVIDYDNGLNTLVCEKCSRRYTARSLGIERTKSNIKYNIIEGVSTMEQEIRVSILKDGKLYNLYSEADHIAPPTNIRQKPHKPESELSGCVVGGYYKNDILKKDNKVANPELIKELHPKFEEVVASEGKDTDQSSRLEDICNIIKERQVVQSPDICEGIVEVKPKEFPTNGQNSVIEDQDNELEKKYAKEALEEQQELDNADDDIVQKSTCKNKANISRYMEKRLKNFAFHESHTTQERSDLIEYFVNILNIKYDFEPDFIVMLATEFVDNLGYVFDEVNEGLSNEEKLAIDCYGDTGYENEPTVERIKPKRRLSSDI